jgi:mono/diheme cytochrome c family protein
MRAESARLAVATLLVLAGGGPRSARAVDVAQGKKVFTERCAACHGPNGGGDGPAAAAITPPPRNFHDPAFWADRTTAQLRQVVKNGKSPTSMMPPFGEVLSDAEIDAVVGYLETFRPGAGPGDGKATGAGPGEDAPGGRDRSGGGR